MYNEWQVVLGSRKVSSLMKGLTFGFTVINKWASFWSMKDGCLACLLDYGKVNIPSTLMS